MQSLENSSQLILETLYSFCEQPLQSLAAKMPNTKPHKPPKTTKPDASSSLENRASKDASNDNVDTANPNEILSAIHTMKEEFVLRFDSLLGAIQGIQGELKAVSVRMTDAEERISTNQDDINSLRAQSNTMKVALEELVLKVDDLENRARRSNLRLVGLPEEKEGANMCTFLEKWIPEVLGEHSFPALITIERAHQIGRVNETGDRSSVRPRVVVMKFLNYADKSRVLKAARSAGHLSCDNQRISFFPDVSTDLLKRRKVFDSVKKQLATLSCPDLRYGIVHPAKLLITIKGRRHTFDNPSRAEEFVRGLKADIQEDGTGEETTPNFD